MWHFAVNWLAVIGAVFALFALFMGYHSLVSSGTSRDDYEGHRHMALGFMWIIYGFGVMWLAGMGLVKLVIRLTDGHW
jgi:hypothetical protein